MSGSARAFGLRWRWRWRWRCASGSGVAPSRVGGDEARVERGEHALVLVVERVAIEEAAAPPRVRVHLRIGARKRVGSAVSGAPSTKMHTPGPGHGVMWLWAAHVDKEREVAVRVELAREPQRGAHGGVHLRPRLKVHAVQVDAARVGAVVAEDDAVRVEHRHELEDILLAHHHRARIVGAQQKVEHALDHVRGGRLAGVHAPRDVDDLSSTRAQRGGLSACKGAQGARRERGSTASGCLSL